MFASTIFSAEEKSYKPPKRLLIEHGAVRLLPWVIGIMFLLCCVLLLVGLMSMRLAGHWQESLTDTYTVQAKNDQQTVDKLLEYIRNNVNVRQATLIPNEDSMELLSPWLGQGDDFQLPALIEVVLQPKAILDTATFQQQLRGLDPSVSVEGFDSWLTNVRQLTGAVRLSVLTIGAVVFLGLMTAIAVTTRIHFALNRRIVSILHLIGATDQYITSQFQRSTVRLVLKSIAIGLGLFMVLVGCAWLLVPDLQTMQLWSFRPGWLEILALILLLVVTPIFASYISRWSAMRALAQHAEQFVQ